MQEVAGDQRHQRRDRAADDAGDQCADQDDADRRRVGDVAHARDDGAVEAFARQARRFMGAVPQKQHHHQRQIQHGIYGERGNGARRRNHNAADRRPETARDVVADAVERDRRRQRFRRHLLADRGLPGRPEQRHAAADHEAQRQQDIRRDEAEPCHDGQHGCADKRDTERDHGDDPPVVHVGDGPGRHRDQHDRQHQRGLHQRDLVGGRRHLRHRPGSADALDQDPQIGNEAGEPDAPEHGMPQRRCDAVSRKTAAFRLVGHDRFRWPSVTGLIPFELKVMPAKTLACPVAEPLSTVLSHS